MSKLEEFTKRTVWIEWLDSQTQSHWQHPSAKAVEDIECVTLGFVVWETDEAIVVAATVAATGSVLDSITIPKVCITRLHEVDWGAP